MDNNLILEIIKYIIFSVPVILTLYLLARFLRYKYMFKPVLVKTTKYEVVKNLRKHRDEYIIYVEYEYNGSYYKSKYMHRMLKPIKIGDIVKSRVHPVKSGKVIADYYVGDALRSFLLVLFVVLLPSLLCWFMM